MKFHTQPLKPTKMKEVNIRITMYGYVVETPKDVIVNITDERPECQANECHTIQTKRR